MCGRYHLAAAPERLAQEFDLDVRENFPPRYNIAPTQPVHVVALGETRARRLALMRWGFVPSWAKKDYFEKVGSKPLINARAETAAEKPVFRNAFKRRRCLLPADGFYEWSGAPGAKTPYRIRRKDEGLFAFAGLWETAIDPDGGEIDTVAILTTAAGADIAPLHDREPVVIPRADYGKWLEADERDLAAATAMLVARPAGFWTFQPVSKAVNNARNEGEKLAEALGFAAAPPAH
ncbi:MAG: SOS response-associated peptidase [Parvularculaceae bacterium]|nr:SOS response-associated peptidase [Parvularculaceae bacterium]